MQLVDTHCHLDLPDFKTDLDDVIKRAREAGVVRMIIPGIDLESSKRSVDIASGNEAVYSAVGTHPHEADNFDEGLMKEFSKLCGNKKVVAVGEIGLDYFRDHSSRENQTKMFRRFLAFAKEKKLPVILHNRQADGDFIGILKEFAPFEKNGVVHCFSGDERFLEDVLGLDLFVSIAGNITFGKSAGLREFAARIPIERLLLETDSPYITPEPSRGKRNEPANVRYLPEVYAKIYDLSPLDIARITTHNANHLFGLGLKEEPKIAYPIRDSLYLNITNECSNRCEFCTRDISDYVKGHNLRLKKEPTPDEIVSDMGDISGYNEIVFCGYGEPTMRLEMLKKVAAIVKKNNKRVRLVTNGHGDLINKKPIARELTGLVDIVSVSLNAPDSLTYEKICRPKFKGDVHAAVVKFIESCVKEGIEVEITCLDFIGEEAVMKCRAVAEGLGIGFRLRHLDVVG